MSERVGIMGCGWMGLPLAKRLIQEGYTVSGTTTDPEKISVLEAVGIRAHQIALLENDIDGDIDAFLAEIDTLFINIPPGLRKNPQSNYVQKMDLLLDKIGQSTVKQLLFASSTSVYGAQEGEITEETPPRPNTSSGEQLLRAEQLFLKQAPIKATIIRFGGLIGPDRHPVTHLAGRKGLKNGNESINLIHLNDCVEMIYQIVKNQYWGEVFNAVYPYHPTKQEYYEKEAQKRNLAPPLYSISDVKIYKKNIKSKNYITKLHHFHTSIIS